MSCGTFQLRDGSQQRLVCWASCARNPWPTGEAAGDARHGCQDGSLFGHPRPAQNQHFWSKLRGATIVTPTNLPQVPIQLSRNPMLSKSWSL